MEIDTSVKDYIRKTEGVYLHGKRLKIVFYYRGVQCSETLKFPVKKITKREARFADRKRKQVLQDILENHFDYRSHFPNSKRADLFCPPERLAQRMTINEALDKWLGIKEAKVRASTYRTYVQQIQTYVRPSLGDEYVDEITPSDINLLLYRDYRHLANRTVKHIYCVVSQVYKMLVGDGVVDRSPMIGVDPPKVSTKLPDVFTKDELGRIASTPTNWVQELNQFLFCCCTGLRISEAFGLAWEDIDLEKWVARISRGVVHGKVAAPKNESSQRMIELIDPAIEILKRQRDLTYMRAPIEVDVVQFDNKTVERESIRPVFCKTLGRSNTWCSTAEYASLFFRGHLKKAKVRHRGAKMARHTFASQMLTAGIDRSWIMAQTGHSTSQVFEKVYALWIKSERPNMAREVSAKIDFGNKMLPVRCQNKMEKAKGE